MKTRTAHRKSNHFLRVIALGRLIYGLILLVTGVAVFNLLGKNLGAEMLRLINQWHLDAHLYYVHWWLQKISTVSHSLLLLLAIGNLLLRRL